VALLTTGTAESNAFAPAAFIVPISVTEVINGSADAEDAAYSKVPTSARTVKTRLDLICLCSSEIAVAECLGMAA
jgi:hypothetical protein